MARTSYYHPRITEAREQKSMEDNPSTWDNANIRLETAQLLYDWGYTKSTSYIWMMELFGIEEGIQDWTPEIMEDMRKLHGPYGKVIYQMIKAKYHDNR